MVRLGLRAKFVFVILVTLSLLLGIIAFVLVRNTHRNLRVDLNNQAMLFANLATKPIGDSFLTYQDSGTGRINDQVVRFTDLDDHITNVAVVDTNGQIVFNQNPKYRINVSTNQAASFETIYSYDSSGYINQVISPLIEDSGIHGYNLIYSISSDSVKAQITQTEQTILISTVLGLGLSAAITFLLIDWLFLRPIRKLSHQALAISSGNLAQQISITNKDEIGDLAVAVNKMSEALKADIAKLTEVDQLKSEFMLITSHNLRTPLTIINGYVDQIKHLKLPTELKEPLSLIDVNTQRLSAFTEDMLAISSVESGQSPISKEPTALNSFLKKIAKEFKVLANQKKISFSAKIGSDNTEVNINPAHLRSAVWNLLDNSIKFTEAGGKISLTALVVDNEAIIIVSDTGVGIAPAEMPKLFTKFHRGTGTMKYQYEGTGIGLYATKLVIERHGGKIEAKSELGRGATFTVKLPVLPDEKAVSDN